MTDQEKKLTSAMLEMQRGFNVKIRADWDTNPPEYTDAIWTEAAEAFNHTNWPWWKNQDGSQIDYGQIKMELIDIWHFLMSELMCYKMEGEETHEDLIGMTYVESAGILGPEYRLNIENVRAAFRMIVATSLLPQGPERAVAILTGFMIAVRALEMTWAEVYKLYVGKNTLNAFRQKNGYKTETEQYKAYWASGGGSQRGWEDNQYLTEILDTMDVTEDVESMKAFITHELGVQFFENKTGYKNA